MSRCKKGKNILSSGFSSSLEFQNQIAYNPFRSGFVEYVSISEVYATALDNSATRFYPFYLLPSSSNKKSTTALSTLKRTPDCAFDLQALVPSELSSSGQACPTGRPIQLLWALAYTLYKRMAIYPNFCSSSSDSLTSIYPLS